MRSSVVGFSRLFFKSMRMLLAVERRQPEVESVLGAQHEFGHLDGRAFFVERKFEVLENDCHARLQLVHGEVLTDAVPALRHKPLELLVYTPVVIQSTVH